MSNWLQIWAQNLTTFLQKHQRDYIHILFTLLSNAEVSSPLFCHNSCLSLTSLLNDKQTISQNKFYMMTAQHCKQRIRLCGQLHLMCVCGSLTYSEVGCCQGVCSVAVLTDDGGSVSLLAVVVTSSSYAGQFTDGWCKDHLDPSCMVAHCHRKHGSKQEEREREQTDLG